MAKELFNNYNKDNTEWVVLSKGRKYLTLKRLTQQKGYRDITMTYSLDAEERLMRCLNDASGGGVDALIGQSFEVQNL